MPLDRDLIDAVKELDEPELRRLYILAHARLEAAGVPVTSQSDRVRLRQRHVKCGKDNCASCPHGPYWYAFWTENGRRRSRYVGRLLDED